MKFATRRNLGLNRPPAIWFIRRFLDPGAEIHFFAPETVVEDAAKIGAVPFHTPGVELHVDKEKRRTTIEAFMHKYGWAGKDKALDLLAEIVNDASFGVPQNEVRHPQAYGIRALNQGFQASAPSDQERMERMIGVYEALYQWCRKQTEPPAPAA